MFLYRSVYQIPLQRHTKPSCLINVTSIHCCVAGSQTQARHRCKSPRHPLAASADRLHPSADSTEWPCGRATRYLSRGRRYSTEPMHNFCDAGVVSGSRGTDRRDSTSPVAVRHMVPRKAPFRRCNTMPIKVRQGSSR